jgi:Holliday junction resolvase RusA-like endonuclease
MTKQLDATIDELPPSVNRLYKPTIVTKHKRKIAILRKTEECKKYEAQVSKYLGEQWMFSNKLDPDKPHEIVLVFYLQRVVNAGWPKTKTKFVKRDVNNLIKLLEDVIAKVAGVDDSAVFDTHVFKRRSDEERVEVVLREIDESCLL